MPQEASTPAPAMQNQKPVTAPWAEDDFVSDEDRLNRPMGQFLVWRGSLFFWQAGLGGWWFLRDLGASC